MATIEFIQKRIDGKLKEIATLEKKISRIEQAKATNWEKNPYYYSERDLTSALKDKDIAEKALANYQAQLEEANNKAASRNVPAIIEFLNEWEIRVTEYYLAERDKFLKAQEEYYAENHRLVELFNTSRDPEVRKQASKESNELRKRFRARWSHVLQFDHGSGTWEQTMMRDIAIEKDRKYDDLINRVIAITGPITDASGLYVGLKGDLDGQVVGEKGIAHVQTIGAGGYNIQCYHYRTLVKKIG